MSFAQAVERQQVAIFRALGEDAVWADGPDSVRIRLTESDVLEPFGASQDVMRARFIRVRRSEVPAPADGEVVVLARGPCYRVIAQPTLDRKGVWVCQVTELPAPAPD